MEGDTHTHTHTHIYIYIYLKRERDRQRQRQRGRRGGRREETTRRICCNCQYTYKVQNHFKQVNTSYLVTTSKCLMRQCINKVQKLFKHHQNGFIWLKDGTPISNSIPYQSGPGSNGKTRGNSALIKISKVTYYHEIPNSRWEDAWPTAEMQPVYSTAPADWSSISRSPILSS